MESNRDENSGLFSMPGLSRSQTYHDDKESDVPLMNQYYQYLRGIFNGLNFSVKQQENKLLCFDCPERDKFKNLLNVMNIKFSESSMGLIIDEKSIKEHLAETKKNLVYLSVCLYLQTIKNLEAVFTQINQKATETYSEDVTRRQKLINKIFNLTVFEFNAHSVEDRFPHIKYHDMQGKFIKNHLLSLLKDKNLEKLISDEGVDAKNPISKSDPGPSTSAREEPSEQKFSQSDSGLVVKKHHVDTDKGPSIHDFFYSQFFNLNMRDFSVPSGEVLAYLKLHYPISTGDQEKLKPILSLFMIKNLGGKSSDLSQLLSPDVKKFIDSQIDENGNCKLSLATLDKLSSLVKMKVEDYNRKTTP